MRNLDEVLRSTLGEEVTRTIAEGEMAEGLVHSPAWPLLVNFAEERCNRSLARLRNYKGSDKDFVFHAWRIWREDEDWLTAIQRFFLAKIEDKEAMREELRAQEKSFGVDHTPEEAQDAEERGHNYA
jgi:hypothetical protein